MAPRDHLRIPSLDGLRAISIGLVVLSHLVPCLHLPWPGGLLAVFDLGRLGVRVFFVISGFLITQLLLDERARRGAISLPRFYFRRTMRIFPPYYAFLIVMFLLRGAGAVAAPSADFLHAATYTSNYFPFGWNLGHSWSLSVEEQFYLIWPALLIALGPRRWLWGVGAILVLSPVTRLWWPSQTRLDTVADSLAVGCLLAGLRDRLIARRPAPRLMLSAWTFVLSFAVVTFIELLATRPSVAPTWLFNLMLVSVQNALIALVVHWSILNHDGWIGRVLNSRPLSFIGVISYSIYIWQQPFLNHFIVSPLTTFPLSLAAVLACAVVSYYGLERPALALRRRLEERRAPEPGPRPAAYSPAGLQR